MLPDARLFPVLERWVFLALMLAAGLTWGLKLEARVDSVLQVLHLVELRVSEMDKTLNRGILPLTEDRIMRMAQSIVLVESSIDQMRTKCDQLSIEVERMKLLGLRAHLGHTKRR